MVANISPIICCFKFHMVRLCFNMDGVATLTGGNMNQHVRLVKGATKAMKAKSLSVWIANERTQQRGVKQYYVTAADGFLLSAIVVIKDSKIPQLSRHLWSKDGGYELWTVFVPNPKRAIARNEQVSRTDSDITNTPRARIVALARAEVINSGPDRLFLENFAAFKIDRFHICYCSNDCSIVRRLLSEDDDGWQGCPVDGCTNFYCARINCHKKLVAHVKMCMQKL